MISFLKIIPEDIYLYIQCSYTYVFCENLDGVLLSDLDGLIVNLPGRSFC